MRFPAFLIALLMLFHSPAYADDASAAQSIIREQTQALERDDAASAYGYATPAIQELFPQAEAFLDMVRRGYTPVYRHQSFEFGEMRVVDGKIAQKVDIVDAAGVAWQALYTLERQLDGAWKISGCVLLKAEGREV